ncbi:MAG: hypothetical protein H8D34_32535 [Chloroflexi bacterium]|nr:hypothetical protein [Chloroflexota bacterium]MBL7164069.1 hypothetical protein [Anaerolineales bacterium]
MKYLQDIRIASEDPKQMESLYQEVLERGESAAFQSDLLAAYEEMPENVLLAAWYYRLQQAVPIEAREKKAGVNWKLAIPLSIITGLFFWLITDTDGPLFLDHLPYLVMFWAPIATIFSVAFLAGTAKQHYRRAVLIVVGLILAGLYVFLVSPGLTGIFQTRYLDLMALHLPLMAWITLGIAVLGWGSTSKDRFAFLIKSIEAMITAGLYLIFGAVLGGITFGMFAALNVNIPDLWMRLIIAGGYGLLPTLAVATIYDPTVAPGGQDFTQGLSKFIATMMRLLLPLTLAVLVIYVFVIPFNFMEPFNQRDVLIVYNIMLFAIMGLLMGATPIRKNDLSQSMQIWLRSGILAVAILGALISIYAMSATVYRTVQWGITVNRLTIIGWNTINIGVLIALIVKQFKDGRDKWIESLQQVFSYATNAYVFWGLFLVVVIPLLFR